VQGFIELDKIKLKSKRAMSERSVQQAKEPKEIIK